MQLTSLSLVPGTDTWAKFTGGLLSGLEVEGLNSTLAESSLGDPPDTLLCDSEPSLTTLTPIGLGVPLKNILKNYVKSLKKTKFFFD